MQAKEWFYRMGQSDSSRKQQPKTRGWEPVRLGWTSQQVSWYRDGYYNGRR